MLNIPVNNCYKFNVDAFDFLQCAQNLNSYAKSLSYFFDMNFDIKDIGLVFFYR